MALNKEDMVILKALVERELAEMREEKIEFVNSPVLSTISRTTENDIPFIKTKALYVQFLEQLLQKL